MITYRKKLCRIGELWFDEEPGDARVDVVRFFQRPAPLPGVHCEEFYSLVIDLGQDLEAILADLDADVRYRLRRAERDGLVYERCDPGDRALLAGFCHFYDEFASLKGLPPINRARLWAYASQGALELSRVGTAGNGTLVWHAYYRGGQRVRGLHSASLYRRSADSSHRSLVGRANSYLHWQDMVTFKAEGIIWYDMGGWYPGRADAAKLGINKFKEDFGGRLVRGFNGETGVTGKGRLLLWLRDAWRRPGTPGEDPTRPGLSGEGA